MITKPLKQGEFLAPSELFAHIDSVLAANPQYMAQPSFWLRNNLDWDQFKKDHLKPLNVGGYCSSEKFYDKLGLFTGHHDILFQLYGARRSDTAAQQTRMKYRVSSDARYLPDDGSCGVQVIGAVPDFDVLPNPVPVKDKAKWSQDKKSGKKVWDTIGIALSHCLRAPQGEALLSIQKEWAKVWSEVELQPSVFQLTATSLPLSPERVLRPPLGATAAVPDAKLEPLDALVMQLLTSEWATPCIDRWDNPSIDLVHSANNPTSLVNAQLAAFRQNALGSDLPTTSSASLVLPGSWMVFRERPGEGARCMLLLANVVKLHKGLGPRDAGVQWTAWVYDHKCPVDPFAPLCGMFHASMVAAPDGSRATNQRNVLTLARHQVILYNARVIGAGKNRRLHACTLRALAEAQPELFKLPKQLPEPFDRDEEEDESDEDVTTDGASSAAVRAARKSAAPAARKGAAEQKAKAKSRPAAAAEKSRSKKRNRHEDSSDDEEEDDEPSTPSSSESYSADEESDDEDLCSQPGEAEERKDSSDEDEPVGKSCQADQREHSSQDSRGEDPPICQPCEAEQRPEAQSETGTGAEPDAEPEVVPEPQADLEHELQPDQPSVGGVLGQQVAAPQVVTEQIAVLVPGTAASSFSLVPGHFFFASIEGEVEAENQTWPIALYYLVEYDRDKDEGKVGWYDRTWTTPKWPSKGMRPGASFRKYCVAVPEVGKKKRPKVDKTWNVDTLAGLSSCTLPVDLDGQLGTASSSNVKVSATFMDNVVVPAFQNM